MSDQKYSAIVLAGGRSSRMGKPKAELPFGAGTMLDHIVTEMARVFEEVIVATASPWERAGVRVFVDDEPYQGPVSALERTLREIHYHRAFVCSCDVPFASGNLANELCEMLGD